MLLSVNPNFPVLRGPGQILFSSKMLSLTHSETVRGTLALVGEHYPKRDIYLKEEKALLLKGAPGSGYRPHKDACKERLSI